MPKAKIESIKQNPEEQAAVILRNSISKMLNSSVITSRNKLSTKLGTSYGGKRDLYEALGYPQLDAIQFEDYYGKYRRQDIAGRIVDAAVDGSWEQKPKILEPKEKESQFEKDWIELNKKLKIYAYLIRVDKLSRIGRFAVLVLGFDDVTNNDGMAEEVTAAKELMYVQPYSEGNTEIAEYETDPTNPRFGLPKVYSVTVDNTGEGKTTSQIKVHHTRVLHIAEMILEGNTFGLPALERVYNRLLNLDLIVGGSAEMFWQGAFPGYAFVADGDADLTATAATLEAEIDLFVHDFKRYMKLSGLKVEKLSSDVANPDAHIGAQLKMVSIASGIPIRILTGSERGELSSSQDESHWNDKLNSRRIDYLEPNIIRPLIDRLIEIKILAEPGKDGYEVEWPDLNAPTESDKADVGGKRANAIKTFTSDPSAELFMTFDSFLLEILELSPAKIERIIDAREKANKEMLRDDGTDDDAIAKALAEDEKKRKTEDAKKREKPKVNAGFKSGQTRDKDGKWSDRGGGSSYDDKKKKWIGADGKPLSAADQKRLKAMGTPPAWTDVKLNPDPEGHLQVSGTAENGKRQPLYTAKWNKGQSAKKFERMKALHPYMSKIRASTRKGMLRGDDTAGCLNTISLTGFRPGGSLKGSTGAVTLLNKNVKINGDVLKFDFIGKKGVRIQRTLTDSKLAKFLRERVTNGAPGDRLFKTNVKKVRAMLKDFSAKSFQVKDIRTWQGTTKAIKMIKEMPIPKNKTAYKKAVNKVADSVAKHLGNTRAVAKKSYIAPGVFHTWDDALM